MTITVQLFAGLKDRLGVSQVEIPAVSPKTVQELENDLIRQYPAAAELLRTSFWAVNQAYAERSETVSSVDEVAIIPPVSGGQNKEFERPEPHPLFEITDSPLSVEQVTRKVLHPDNGASITFIGTTREHTRGKRTIRLEYEAYIPMALRTMEQIAEEISERWPHTLCAVSHRIGLVRIKEISVIIAVSSPHRAACYEASRYAIDRLKQIAPIWKKEQWSDGSEWIGCQQGSWDPTASIDHGNES